MINLFKVLTFRDHPKCVALVPGVLENLKEQNGAYTTSIIKKKPKDETGESNFQLVQTT